MIHRPTREGTEDYLRFDVAPSAPEIVYEVTLGAGVAGLRLVERTLELVDAAGSPRLRMAPPFLIDAGGQAREATVAVEGCAYDAIPGAPWGRAVVAPTARACRVRVGWDAAAVVYPALVDPGWSTTASMINPRLFHTATVLPDGRVLVVAGYGGSMFQTIPLSEIYDPVAQSWAATGNLKTKRRIHTATLLTNGKVLVTGGLLTVGLATAELWDAGTFTDVGSMATGRYFHTATRLADGRVLVTGGGDTFPLATTEIFESGIGDVVAGPEHGRGARGSHGDGAGERQAPGGGRADRGRGDARIPAR